MNEVVSNGIIAAAMGLAGAGVGAVLKWSSAIRVKTLDERGMLTRDAMADRDGERRDRIAAEARCDAMEAELRLARRLCDRYEQIGIALQDDAQALKEQAAELATGIEEAGLREHALRLRRTAGEILTLIGRMQTFHETAGEVPES